MEHKPIIQFKVIIDEVVLVDSIDFYFKSVVLYNKLNY